MAERLRIAFLVDRFGRRFGGAEAYAVNLVELLCKRHDVTVIAHDFDHELPVSEIRVSQQRKVWPSWIRVWHFAWRARALTRTGYDVVHSHMDGGAGDIQVMHVTPFRFRRLNGKSWWRRALVWIPPRNLAYLLIEGASVTQRPGRTLVAVSPFLRNQLHASYGESLPITVVPPGADAVAYDPNVRERTRAALGWGPTDKGVLLVARNPFRKGLESVLQAVETLPDDFHLAVVGAGPELAEYVARRFPSLHDRVNLIAATPEVTPYYQAADVYVHPTLGDSFGMAPLEAMAHELPVIVSSVQYCGLAQYLTHRRDAWVLDDPNDHDALAQAMIRLGNDDLLRRGIVRHASRIVDAFAWSKVAERYEQIYRESIRERLNSTPALPPGSERIVASLSLS